MREIWHRIECWLSVNHPENLKGLRTSASPDAISEVEKFIGVALPEDVKSSYLIHDGQSDIDPSLFGEWHLLPLKNIKQEWKLMNELLEKGKLAGEVKADHRVRSKWWGSKWIPIMSNGAGDLFCIDLDPTPSGKSGQIISYWHMLDKRDVIADSFEDYLSAIAPLP
jgi:cell wall assembly regulator SMI1